MKFKRKPAELDGLNVSPAIAKPMLGVVFNMSNKIEIIGVGYGKDVNIGESYLQESVVNMWDSPPPLKVHLLIILQAALL